MEEDDKKKVHPLGVLLLLPFILFFLYTAYVVMVDAIFNIFP